MKKIKRLIIFLLSIAVILSAFLPTTASAANGRYRIEEAKLEVTIPATYTVITRNTPSNAEIFTRLGLSYSAFMSNMKSGSIYLDAVSDSHSEEIVFTCQENIISDFSLLSDTLLNTLATTTINEMEKLGISVIKYDIYHHSQAKFLRIYWSDSANFRYGLQYYTVRDNTAMNFTLQSYEGSINSRQESVMKTVVDSVEYDTASPVVSEGEDTDSFVYTDSDIGIKFTVPANWKQDEFTEDREYLSAKFVSTKEDGCTIIFAAVDAWAELSPSEKIGLSRADVDNSIFTKADIAEMFSTTEDDISLLMYNGVEYYKCTRTADKEVYGLSLDITMTQLLCVDNGWMYAFQFNGKEDHKLYSDFEELVRSVKYPTSQTTTVYDDEGEDENENENKLSYTGNKIDNQSVNSLIIVVLILLIVLLIIVVFFIFKKKNGKTSQAVKHCMKCGQQLPVDSDFCHMCGTKVEKGE
ncbi:MAG: zinc ribbon domain-containing protein [Ruminococcaceae bacterium]|nr:zinc ribbon domain-containing protein [Oscillospiraceae bacterium]